MTNAEHLIIRINGRDYRQWVDFRMRREMESLAWSVSVQLWDAWQGDDLPFVEGDPIEVRWRNDLEFSGYIDQRTLRTAETNTLIAITARSKTGDCIDCSATNKPGEWKNAELLTIATDILGEFGLGAGSDVDLGSPIRAFALAEGETANEALQRLARMRGVVAVGDEFGDVKFTRAGAQRADTRLRYGVNIREAEATANATQRYSEYVLKAQVSGTDSFFGSKAAAVSATATDSDVTRYRPLVIMAESQDSGAELKKRAEWERTYRAGRARRASVVTPGAEHTDGYLWKPNLLVDVLDPRIRVAGELLIVATDLAMSERGTTTTLELANPAALTVEPLAKPKKKGGFSSWL